MVALAGSLTWLGTGLGGIVMGQVAERLGVRFTTIFGAVMIGVGLAFAVFVDATVVRGICVPAALALLGDRSWYLPRWLRWLPQAQL